MNSRTALATPQSWQREALCRGSTARFFSERSDGATIDVANAKKVCAQCPVREQCLEYALENREKFGVWGGLSVKQRNQIIRRRMLMPNPAAPFAQLVLDMDAMTDRVA